ncbi:hypothetical protein [Bartonella sp. ML71XJBT]|uniref:hypothetical protein n=1 Tax=Bartonella sp. ML71XJBT TaxID=3019094 RepID=UPI00235E2289|nr:hypothetical protein [Bartonella sp. ML71XJBT]
MRGRSQPAEGITTNQKSSEQHSHWQKLLQELSSFLLSILSNYFMNREVFWSHTQRPKGIQNP